MLFNVLHRKEMWHILYSPSEKPNDLQTVYWGCVYMCRRLEKLLCTVIIFEHMGHKCISENQMSISHFSGGCPDLKVTFSKDMKDTTRSRYACYDPIVDYGEKLKSDNVQIRYVAKSLY